MLFRKNWRINVTGHNPGTTVPAGSQLRCENFLVIGQHLIGIVSPSAVSGSSMEQVTGTHCSPLGSYRAAIIPDTDVTSLYFSSMLGNVGEIEIDEVF